MSYAAHFPLDYNVNPYAGTDLDTNKNVAQLAFEMIEGRRSSRADALQFVKDMRAAAGSAWNADLRSKVLNYVRFEVQTAGGRLSHRAFFQEAQELIQFSKSPQTIRESSKEAKEVRAVALMKARIAEAAGRILMPAAA
jgi:hypothetical protein